MHTVTHATRRQGTVDIVRSRTGYGFIIGEDGVEYHFAFANVERGSLPLYRYQIVEFDVMKCSAPGKKDMAFHVRRV